MAPKKGPKKGSKGKAAKAAPVKKVNKVKDENTGPLGKSSRTP